MENVILNVSIVYDTRGEFKAMMEERFFHSKRYYYLMDEHGQHEFVCEMDIYKYKIIGMVTTMDANAILRLLDELNNSDDGEDVKTYIWGFNQFERLGERKGLPLDKRDNYPV